MKNVSEENIVNVYISETFEKGGPRRTFLILFGYAPLTTTALFVLKIQPVEHSRYCFLNLFNVNTHRLSVLTSIMSDMIDM